MHYSLLPVIALLSSQVAAHGVVKSLTIGGKTVQGYSSDFKYQKNPPAVAGWTADVEDQGPVLSSAVNNPDIICHRSATPGGAYAEVAAGSKLTLNWTPWPESHKGPVMDMLAPCNGECTNVDKTKLKFFTIDKAGMTSTNGDPPQFADDDMIAAGSQWTITIPASLKPGNYVLRHETIALHEGFKEGGAQHYPQCFNLKVTGSGTTAPPAGKLGTELYSATEPGILFDIYKKFKSTSDYPIPGPAVWDGASSGSTSTPVPAAAPVIAPVAPVAPVAPASAPAAAYSAPASPAKGGSYAEGSQAPAKPATSAAPQYEQAPQPKKNSCHKKRSHPRDLAL